MIANKEYSWYFMHISSIFTLKFISLYSLEMRKTSSTSLATSGFRIIPYSLVVVFVFRNEEKLLEILVYSSFRRVGTSGFWNNSVASSS